MNEVNKTKFVAALTEAYTDLFKNNSSYSRCASVTTPGAMAEKVTELLIVSHANNNGEGVKRACKTCGIPITYKAIKAFLTAP